MYNPCIVRHPAEGRVLGNPVTPAVLRHGLRNVLDGVEFAHHQKGVSIPAIPRNVTCMPLPYRLFMADRGIP